MPFFSCRNISKIYWGERSACEQFFHFLLFLKNFIAIETKIDVYEYLRFVCSFDETFKCIFEEFLIYI